MKNVKTTDNLNLILEGINLSSDMVKSTMGANGKLVLINDEELRFTKDGVSVAKNIKFEDVFKDIGAEIVKTTAGKTVAAVGDGTTCTTVLLQSFANSLLNKDIDNIREELDLIETEISNVLDYLNKSAIPVSTIEDIKSIATIASDSEEMGTLIADTYEKTGMDSLVSLELGEGDKSYNEVKEGIEYKEGYLHPAFSNMPNKQCVFYNPMIVILSKPLTNKNEVESLFKASINDRIPLILMAPRFSTDFLRSCVYDLKGGLEVCLVKLPGYGRYMEENALDIRAYCDNKHRVEKAVVGPNYLRIYNTNTPNLDARIQDIKNRQETAIDALEDIDYIKRIHRLKNSTGIIYAGGITEQAAKEEFDRLDDALGAVKAAIKYGYVVGGGLALYNASNDIARHPVLKKALQAPIRQIIDNSGDIPEIVFNNITDCIGYNVRNHKYENFIETGIIDPVEVLTQSLINSFTTVKMLSRASYAIDIKYEKKLF
jgi:chaperonin GroEL